MTYHIHFLQFQPTSRSAHGYYELGLELATKSSSILFKAAVQAFSRSLEIDSCYAPAYLMRAKLRFTVVERKIAQGTTMGLRKKLLKVIDDTTKYICIHDNDYDAYVLRAKAYLVLIRYDKYAAGAFLDDYEAIHQRKGPIDLFTKQLAWVGLQASRVSGDYTQALHYLDMAYDGVYDHNYFIRRSVIFDEMGNSEDSAADLLRARSKSLLSTAFEKAALFEEAEKILLEQIETAPLNIWPKIRLAQFYERIGVVEQSIQTYQYVLRQLASTHRYYAVIQYEVNRLERSMD
ncbi:hypothetical protein PVA44_05135 [Entomospira nematocerorum]|uniref:Tetratricopeptide repeat protein n=1 Tax=Entomospira nematocerorum TaxID=2719987 RepID=A0A968GB27_9SPIO|nr:hypothetical protein [Entomospira nematocera]NIZ46595.1 hypothetical protein [Entomospira nematocera]WDI33607.1 hypothetical protein PVA44_05135 [Entomospira nematocera]